MLHLHLFWQTFWPALPGFLLQSSVYLALNSPTWDEKCGCVLGLRGVFFSGPVSLKNNFIFIPEFCYPVSSIPPIYNIDLTFLPEKGAVWLTEVAVYFSLREVPLNRTRARDHPGWSHFPFPVRSTWWAPQLPKSSGYTAPARTRDVLCGAGAGAGPSLRGAPLHGCIHFAGKAPTAARKNAVGDGLTANNNQVSGSQSRFLYCFHVSVFSRWCLCLFAVYRLHPTLWKYLLMTNSWRTISAIPQCLRNKGCIFITAPCIYSSVSQKPSLLQGVGWQSKSCPENQQPCQHPLADGDTITSATTGTPQSLHQMGFFVTFLILHHFKGQIWPIHLIKLE